MKTKAIALLRSATKSDRAINKQRQSLQNYSDKHGINIVKFYIENGVSGLSMQKNRFSLMLSDINENLDCPSILLVSSITRISRNYNELHKVTAALKTNGIKLTSVEEEVMENEDELSKTLIRKFQFYIREFERNRLSWIIRKAKSKIAIKGYFPGGPPPFGYTAVSMKIKNSDKVRKKLVIHKEESEIVKKVFELAYLRGPFNKNEALKISTELNESNIHCRGKLWTANKISNLLNNSTYYGEYIWGKKRDSNCKDNPPIRINVPVIITKNIFMQANKK